MDKNSVAGIAMAPAVIGIVSLLASAVPFLRGDYVGAGLFFIAAALSFGLLSIGLLKE